MDHLFLARPVAQDDVSHLPHSFQICRVYHDQCRIFPHQAALAQHCLLAHLFFPTLPVLHFDRVYAQPLIFVYYASKLSH